MSKVSVLTPVYNTNPTHLRECIESVLNQTFTDFEFLILNDSPDNHEIAEIVKSYKDSRIKYFCNNCNIGISASRNKLLDLATGQYIAIFDHDDISLPTRLAQEVEYLDNHPEIGVVSGQIQAFGDDNWISTNPEYDADIKTWLCLDCFVAHTATMVRASVIRENDIRYNNLYTPAEDYHLWWQLMRVTCFYNLPDVLVKYRWHTTNTSSIQEHKMRINQKAISLQIRNAFPAYWDAMRNINYRTSLRLRLFGIIPLIKVKHGWIQLFECLPILKLKRE